VNIGFFIGLYISYVFEGLGKVIIISFYIYIQWNISKTGFNFTDKRTSQYNLKYENDSNVRAVIIYYYYYYVFIKCSAVRRPPFIRPLFIYTRINYPRQKQKISRRTSLCQLLDMYFLLLYLFGFFGSEFFIKNRIGLDNFGSDRILNISQLSDYKRPIRPYAHLYCSIFSTSILRQHLVAGFWIFHTAAYLFNMLIRTSFMRCRISGKDLPKMIIYFVIGFQKQIKNKIDHCSCYNQPTTSLDRIEQDSDFNLSNGVFPMLLLRHFSDGAGWEILRAFRALVVKYLTRLAIGFYDFQQSIALIFFGSPGMKHSDAPTLDFANAFLFPGVNSRAELVLSILCLLLVLLNGFSLKSLSEIRELKHEGQQHDDDGVIVKKRCIIRCTCYGLKCRRCIKDVKIFVLPSYMLKLPNIILATRMAQEQPAAQIANQPSVSFQPVPEFNPDSEVGESLGTRWMQDFEMFILASGITDAKRKRALLLYQAGQLLNGFSLKSLRMVEKSKKYQAGKHFCQQLEKCIKEGDITLSLLEVVDKERENVSMLCAIVLHKSMPEHDLGDLRKQILDEISSLTGVVEDCSEKFQLLESAINYGKKISNDVYPVNGVETIIETFNYLKETLRTRKINELQADKFWGTLFPFVGQAEALQPLVNSLSFMTVAKNGLKKLSNSSADEDGNQATTAVIDFFSLMMFLTTKAIEEFKAQWNPVLNNPGSLSVETMKTVLGTLKRQNQLDGELEFLEIYFRKTFSPMVKVYIEDYVKYPYVLGQVRHVIGILQIFGLADPSNEVMKEFSKFQTILENSDKLTLASLHQSMEDVMQIVSSFSGEDLDCVIKELSRSSALLDFIEEIFDEDIRFLIDAVEEHSDQFVFESSVSDLIDVHGFLAPLIKKKSQKKCNPLDFLKMLQASCLGHRDVALKIQHCSTNVNSLRGLYMSIANRGEITKEIIGNCLNKGEYWVSQKNGKCETKMSYVLQGSGEDKTCNYSLSDLHDLRSRAHLIVSSHKNAIKVPSSHFQENGEDIDFDGFINQVNLVTEISTLLSELRSSGYVKYRQFWKRMKTTNDLQANRDGLQHDLKNWEKILKTARENFYYLNYYSSDQLCTLNDFLINKSNISCDEVLSFIHFVDRTITKQQLQQYQASQKKLKISNSSNIPELLLSTVGQALEKIFRNSQSVIRFIQDDGDSQSHSKLEATVTPGEIFVASLEPESPLTANVILTLYENTSTAFPEPHQIVFCSSQTTWEEMYLLLQRCFAHSKYLHRKSLFCIANIEVLPNELQFRLVDAIKEKQRCLQSSEFEENADYQLALICRGGDHHHIVEQFAQYSHHIAGMSDLVLTHRLKSGWPDVKMITSTLPGLGKTEQIKREAVEKSMNLATFSISGPFEPRKLIQRLKELKLKKYHCLHLDIGEVSDPLALDTFLFQLIVTGTVSAGNKFFHLPITHVYIEIANTLKDSLRESLVVSKYFTRIHLQWQNYKNLLVSTEITSDMQVVCQYLDMKDRACIESKEVHFLGPEKSKPLPTHRCQELLATCFSSDSDISFTTIHIFLGVLAEQLLKFTKSTFFKIEKIKSMVDKETRVVRTNLFEALLNVSKEFASRAITTCRSSDIRNRSQRESARALDKEMVSTANYAKDMVERVKGMIQWEDSNHLLVVFHGLNSQAITAVYRNKALVPLSVEKLLKSQMVKGNKELEDFKAFNQEQLQEKLEKIACMKRVEKKNLFSSYALTPDNILKMILIILRVRVNIPVIIMGETGCGKTSLVRYLANTCGVQFYKLEFHAGISQDEIVTFINKNESHARDIKEQIWIFLDEINTCDHLGLISDIMCHHSLLGRQLSKNLVFLAACNPYKLRPKEHIKTAGLEGKNITDEYSGLVYRVHSLPEAMIDYVWDYGSLSPKDERDYIQRMVRDLPKNYEGLLVDLLATSQKFIRDAEKNPFCVSLRDVHRCISLISWFQDMTKKRQELKSNKDEYPKHLKKYHSMSERYNTKPMIKSIVLALAHCYLSRLPTAELRKNYRKRMIDLFKTNGTIMTFDENLDSFSAIVRMEEEDYLDRMELPPGTARNAALRENVFVMLVCILNRIPIFVVGKPGCSKSLSIQLIRSNLRGRDSQDPMFRNFPQLYVVSYQGSESSTSEGIIKVFEKARKYKSHNKNVLPVVLLDEVGLAENSKYNPLKVLHSLLEPGEGKMPDVSVVGISNWSLDAAKMNRAIHLSRPEPTKDDLYETGLSLHYADGDDNSQYLGKKELHCLAEAYFEYQAQQTHANFHGLRDYYSLIKSLTGCSNFEEVNISLQRNFGGLPGDVSNIQKTFLDKLKKLMISSAQDIIPVTQLIQKNLEDPHARHLMLITSGDSAIGILKQSLAELGKETIMIYGSRFEEDLSEEYNYRILSRIILCMERECILILRDLESIYGSLYDMLNQNYAVVGNRKNCRVALGPYSNPMCQVNDGFRCIVLIDQHKVDYSDPPFLNRFEKQVLRFSDVLTKDQQNVITKLRHWVQGVSTVESLESHFKETDMFIGFHVDTLPSLALSYGHDTPNEVLKKCKSDLAWIASPDGVLRAQKCKLLKEDSQEVEELCDEYFKKPLHHGFAAFMKYVSNNHQKSSFFASDEIGSKIVVMTFSNIHTDIRQCLGNGFRCQVERLSAYKSEKQLVGRINEFWSTPEKELLVLQCKPDLDGTHLLLARSIIEEKRNSYKQCLSKIHPEGYKHVCIVIHVQRVEEDSVPWQFSFLCGWRQVFLDVLETPPVPLNEILGESIQKLLTSSIWPLRIIAQNDLLWCFTCIKYTRSQRPVESVLHIAKNLFNSEKVSQVIERLVLQSIDVNALEQDQETYFKENWQVKVACDRQSLVNSSTLYCAMEQFISRLVRNPLAKIVYFLEKENAWPPHLVSNSNETLIPKLEDLWCNFIMNNAIFKISDIPEPLGAESYGLDNTILDLCLPFSQVIIRKIDAVKGLFLEDYATLVENEDHLNGNGQLKQTVQQQQLERFSKMIINLVPELYCFISNCYDLYMKDIFDSITADFSPKLSRSQRISTAQATLISEVIQNLPAKDIPEFCTLLHTFVWLHREHILDLLRMVDCCQPFVGFEVLLNVTDEMFHTSEDVMFVKSHETDEVHSTPNPQENQEEAAEEEIEHREAVEEEMEHDEDSERFGDILVTAYCEEMLPSQEVVQKNGGLEPWIRNANLLLSLAFKISENSPAFHYLRLCVDFSRIIFTPNALPTSLPLLYALHEIGITLRPEYLDHEESFETITNKLIKPLKEEMKNHTDKHEALQKFSTLFYGRCIDTNVDTCGARRIVEQVLSLERPELVMMMSPVLLRLLMVEEKQSPGIFMDLITNPSVIQNCPCLQTIDDVFKDSFFNGSIHHDSYPAVMICDLIQCLLHFEDHFKINDISSSDCNVLVLVRSAMALLSQNSEYGCGLSVLSAVAFLRGFFSMLAQFIAGNPNVLKEDNPYYIHVIPELNSLLKGANSTLQVFFMKQLHEDASLFDLQKWFGENNVLPSIEELCLNEKKQDKAEFTSVFKYPEYDEAKAAYWKLKENDDSSMHGFLTKCSNSPGHAFALLGILINMMYLKRAVRKLTDKEEQLVDWFAAAASFPMLFQELLLRIIGRRDFECSQLQLSPASSVKDVEMALLVLHISCVVATGALSEDLPMYRYLINPVKFERPCVLAHCREDVRSVFEDHSSVKESVCFTCACGVRLAFKTNVNEKVCPHCYEVLNDEASSSTSPKTFATLSVSSNGHKSPKWYRCTKYMNPAVYRALHVIVYSSYYAGIALGTSSEENLSTALNLLCGYDLDTDSTSPADFCFKTMESDLSCLMKILSCKKNVAIRTLHLVVEKSSDIIRSNNLLGTNNCSTPKMRREWEAVFSQLTKTMFLNARETLEETKEIIQRKQTEDNQDVTLECRIMELDDYPEDPEEQNQQLKRLFRVTKQPRFEDFRSAFLYYSKDVQVKHSFLTLFFAKCDQLSIIGNLHHLLKWSRLVSSALTHRISRKDAQSKSINDFISGHLLELNRSPRETESLKVLFNNFKEAWNKMRLLVNEVLIDKEEEMPRLRETDYVAYCLTESDCGIYLQTAIEILVSHQNSILDSIISLSSHVHPVLSFLGKENCSGVVSISIQDVKEKKIISFKWSDDLFQHAQKNPEYGKGQQITYDFERIEIELAKEIAFGKCYLTGTLNKFIFAKELFHSCGPLLTEIRSIVRQNPSLPEEVRKGLSNLKERRIKEAQDLLQHIEVLMYLLKRKLKNFNVNMTLEELAEKWSPMLPSPFPVNLLPQPRSSIKIEHVAALYEALEDILADGAIEGLADRFRDDLPVTMEKSVSAMLDKEIDQLKPHNFLKALRRFVFRYLSTETDRYWPDKDKTFESLKYLEELEKDRKSNTSRQGARGSSCQPQTVKRSGRRRLKNFSRS
ncbi:E3 ubiquitin- ligase RNF213, partial [Paramuricea clavata]